MRRAPSSPCDALAPATALRPAAVLLGSYASFFEVINVSDMDEGSSRRRRLWAPPSEGHSPLAYWGSLLYLIGAVIFQLPVTFPLVATAEAVKVPWMALVFNWLPQVHARAPSCVPARACLRRDPPPRAR